VSLIAGGARFFRRVGADRHQPDNRTVWRGSMPEFFGQFFSSLKLIEEV